MELEFKDDSRRGRFIVIIGLILAVMAGGAAFYLVSQAQQEASSGGATVPAVVALKPIGARMAIAEADVTVRNVPIDPTNASGVIADVGSVIGRLAAVPILEGQLVTSNLLASSAAGAGFSILDPGEEVTADSEAWRAVSITVPDDLAVGGLLEAGQTVDVFVTAIISVPEDLAASGKYYSDRSTKVVYQDMRILAREGAFYILRADLEVAEEISHLQASGNATFSLALRPDVDTRIVDTADLGETTNEFITRYDLPIPETYPAGSSAVRTPRPSPTPSPTPEPSVDPNASPEPSPTP